jgi:hypothetical protein
MLINGSGANAGSYKQEYDLYLDGVKFTPLCASPDAFSGIYDGNSKSIHNLVIDTPDADHVGLFSACYGAVIRSLTIASGSITGRNNVAAFTGQLNDTAASITDCVNHATITGNNMVSGIVAAAVTSTIKDCTNYGTVNINLSEGAGICAYVVAVTLSGCQNYGTVSGYNITAGILGSSQGTCTITDNTNYGTVSGQSSVGGIAAALNTELTDCVNEGRIEASSAAGGGIAGIVTSGGRITGCENKGVVVATGDNVQNMGGIAGSISMAYLLNSYNRASGAVSGYNNIGGVAGQINNSNVEYCENYAPVTATYGQAGGVVGRSSGFIYWCNNFGAVTGVNQQGGIAGNTTTTARIRMSVNNGMVNGTAETGGIAGYSEGTISASINKGTVTGSGERTGGIVGGLSSGACRIVACINRSGVSGTAYVGGIAGAMSDNALVDASYSIGSISGSSYVGGICGNLEDAASTINNSYWANYVGVGVAGEATLNTVYYFNNGTTTPPSAVSGWPDSSLDQWGLDYAGNNGEGGLWWKSLGTSGTTTYPTLFYE